MTMPAELWLMSHTMEPMFDQKHLRVSICCNNARYSRLFSGFEGFSLLKDYVRTYDTYRRYRYVAQRDFYVELRSDIMIYLSDMWEKIVVLVSYFSIPIPGWFFVSSSVWTIKNRRLNEFMYINYFLPFLMFLYYLPLHYHRSFFLIQLVFMFFELMPLFFYVMKTKFIYFLYLYSRKIIINFYIAYIYLYIFIYITKLKKLMNNYDIHS